MSGSINWGTVYNTPIGQILQDLNPNTFAQLITQETQTQVSTYSSQAKQDNTQISAWTTLQSDAQSFASDLTTLSTASTYNQLTATSSNNNVATAVDQSAQQGSYTITVNALAQSEIDTGSTANMTVTNPNATLTVPGGTTPLQGTFSIKVGTQPAVSITMPSSGESLNGLAALINQQSGIGATASVVQNSQGNWVLEIQANQTGQAVTYTDAAPSGSAAQTAGGPLYYLGIVSSDGTTPGTTSLSAANVLQAQSSAQVSFGSTFNAANAITSTSNTFTNLIPGMTVTAQQAGTTTISVTPNVSSMVKSVKQFASDWNQWVSDTQTLAEAGQVVSSGSGASTTYNYVQNQHQELTSGTPGAVLNEVQQVLGSTTNGLSGAYQSLADVGLTFTSSGSLTVNDSTLTQALTTDPSAVQAIFSSLSKTLGQGGTNPGILSGFSLGPTSTAGSAITQLTSQAASDQGQVSLLNQQMTAQEQQAIVQYGQWVNQLSQYSDQYSLLSALFNTSSGSSTTGG
jgi:flagellar hook-associated protein 2